MAVSYEIHPSIGVARVGDSADDYFLLEDSLSATTFSYRSHDGRLKRQGARFHVFRCERDESGSLQRAIQVSTADAEIIWTVHLVNRKGVGRLSTRAGRRNSATGDDEKDGHLIIDPGPRTVSGASGRCPLDTGSFLGKQVYLGEAWTDDHGSLTVLGGRGVANCVPDKGSSTALDHFADNDNWHDDVCDGAIRAYIKPRDGSAQIARPAWLIVAPPDYAPTVNSVVTLHDVATDVAISRGWAQIPEKPSFRHDIYPILSRLVKHQWVNEVFRSDYGPGGKWDFSHLLSQLADPTKEVALRREFLLTLRNPFGVPQHPRPQQPKLRSMSEDFAVLSLTARQFMCLQQWADGHFLGDFSSDAIDEARPDYLDRINLMSCIGGSLRPGLEVSEIVSDPEIYCAPYCLDCEKLQPGKLTENTSVPWQADYYTCKFDGTVAWWPSHRPDHVYQSYEAALTGTMVNWARGVSDLNEMLKQWSRLGILTSAQAPGGQGFIVESERDLP
jgi:hypothetical protein